MARWAPRRAGVGLRPCVHGVAGTAAAGGRAGPRAADPVVTLMPTAPAGTVGRLPFILMHEGSHDLDEKRRDQTRAEPSCVRNRISAREGGPQRDPALRSHEGESRELRTAGEEGQKRAKCVSDCIPRSKLPLRLLTLR